MRLKHVMKHVLVNSFLSCSIRCAKTAVALVSGHPGTPMVDCVSARCRWRVPAILAVGSWWSLFGRQWLHIRRSAIPAPSAAPAASGLPTLGIPPRYVRGIDRRAAASSAAVFGPPTPCLPPLRRGGQQAASEKKMWWNAATRSLCVSNSTSNPDGYCGRR